MGKKGAILNMEQEQRYDYRAYDRIWKRVSPTENPYPEVRAELEEEDRDLILPGAESNPCCMGTIAAQSLNVIQGFAELEAFGERIYETYRARVPQSERALFTDLAEQCREHLRRMQAVIYLISGECYALSRNISVPEYTKYCDLLRYCYHEQTCGSFNYLRTSQTTNDPCLRKIMAQISAEDAAQADAILKRLGEYINK